MSNQFMARPMTKSNSVRLKIFCPVCADHLNSVFLRLRKMENPIMKRKKGNTRSQGVMPSHFECFSVENISFPAPLFTSIMNITVIPLRMSTASRREPFCLQFPCLDVEPPCPPVGGVRIGLVCFVFLFILISINNDSSFLYMPLNSSPFTLHSSLFSLFTKKLSSFSCHVNWVAFW